MKFLRGLHFLKTYIISFTFGKFCQNIIEFLDVLQ